ncbi:bifunctional RNase H/acid phosphatase [Streptomyces sp. TRM66268-LWL]|uniref:Bifunctional RNase H/acid phosphatase n=1 Tax=Streptomyces polyasparticus TaxID=2767826 RepID=A0ABR7SBU3_9ACTN|nr:bifunctional RNase H/acid phosphatase [Streptomyces polyasparticus]MBC9712484.1 bifunctional RNase H/acid phosphatase [Streptomyces polyasparticus]
MRFVIEADGGSRGNPGPAGYGAVVIDGDSGEVLAERAEFIGVATNNVAEYRGLIAGLRAAFELDPAGTVRVRMDSKLVVEQMSGRWKIKHPDMKPLAAEARSVFPASSVTYEWIPREENKHADRLANEAMDAGKRGEQWEASASTAELDTRAARNAASTAPEPSGPVGDAAAGAAAARAALSSVRGAGAVVAEAPPAPAQGWSAPDMGAPATFVLLRHGETALTPQKRFSGSGGTDPVLSEVGLGQAERVAAALAVRGTVQAIVTSPLTRCRQTASAVAARLGLDVTVEEGLRETDFGAFEGLTFAEAKERFPAELDAWLASPDAAPPGGESFAEVAVRVAETRDRLVERYAGRTVLLVTHVTPVKTLVRLALGAPPESLFRMELSAASLTAIAYYADGNASVRLFNDTSHLRA